MARKKMYMQTTTVPASKTFGEVTQLLADAGASRMVQEYKNGRIVGMKFALLREGQEIPFILPLRTEPILRELQKSRPPGNREKFLRQDEDAAIRIAWRQIYRWLEAQFALINLGMSEAAEVFLPYVQIQPNRTMFDEFRDSGLKMLPERTGD